MHREKDSDENKLGSKDTIYIVSDVENENENRKRDEAFHIFCTEGLLDISDLSKNTTPILRKCQKDPNTKKQVLGPRKDLEVTG